MVEKYEGEYLMRNISLTIFNKKHQLKKAKLDEELTIGNLTATGKDFVYLAAHEFFWEEGDFIQVFVDQPNTYLVVKLDETLDSTLIYLAEKEWIYPVSLTKNAQEAHSERRFKGSSHYLSVRTATSEEIGSYRNLALNPHDQQNFAGAYPHAFANVETRNDATFYACNAVDGVYANRSHGAYPYQSWGINQQPNAELTIDFGRQVILDKVIFILRADFPHDNYWQSVSLFFSDGTKEVFKTIKTEQPQVFHFTKRMITTVTLGELIQSEVTSLFPALTQIELFGKNRSE